jgi:hypothetical protein
MALADQPSGNPPAVTHEMLEQWRKLAEDVGAALTMGGEAGMDMLRGLMAEWCETVEDVNKAREICVEMAAEGRRHEAIRWHADGFFDVADRLSPDRPGWQAWEEAFADLGVIVPRVNYELKEMADLIHAELLAQDLSGRSLEEHIDTLRRNVLARGHFGERLTILQEIRTIDPSATIWEEMLEPIRARRSGEVEAELTAAIATEDFTAIDRLKREADSGDWGSNGIPSKIGTMLDAAANWHLAISLRRTLADSAAELLSKSQLVEQAMRNGGANAVSFPSTLNAAVKARETYQQCRQRLHEAVAVTRRVPAIGERVAKSGVAATAEQSDAAARGASKIIGDAEDYWRWVQKFRQWEADAEGVIHSAPLHGGRDWDDIKRQGRKWLDDRAAGIRINLGKLQAKAPCEKPQSTLGVERRLDETVKAVQERLDRIALREKLIIVGALGAIGLVALALVLVFALASSSRS